MTERIWLALYMKEDLKIILKTFVIVVKPNGAY